MTEEKPKKPRGFAALSPEQRKEISSRGGKAAHEKGTAHRWTREEASKYGKIGGQSCAEKPGFMSEIGKLGGVAAHSKKPAESEVTS